MENVTFGLALVAGLLSFISPCVLPLVPAYIGYMGGRLTHNVARQTSAGGTTTVGVAMRLQMLLHGLAFVLGFTVVFVLIGFLTTALASIAGSIRQHLYRKPRPHWRRCHHFLWPAVYGLATTILPLAAHQKQCRFA